MHLTPRELEKLVIYQMADIAQRRRAKGLKLNHPEAMAVICATAMEGAREGKSVEEVMTEAAQVLTASDVMEGVPEMIPFVQLEAVFTDGSRLIDVKWVQQHFARVRAGIAAMKLLCWKNAWSIANDCLSPADASATKVFGSEFRVEAYRLLLEVVGQRGLLRKGSHGAVLAGRVERAYRSATIITFGGGTNEIQRDIISAAGLGMPREAR